MFRHTDKIVRILHVRSHQQCKINFFQRNHQVWHHQFAYLFVVFHKNRQQITISLQRSFSVNSCTRNQNKLINNLYGCRNISNNRSFLFKDNKSPTEPTTVKNLPEDDHPVEDLVNAPIDLKQSSLEINTNKGKLVVTTSTSGTELKNVVLEVKPDKKETDGSKAEDLDDAAKKVRVSRISSLSLLWLLCWWQPWK